VVGLPVGLLGAGLLVGVRRGGLAIGLPVGLFAAKR